VSDEERQAIDNAAARIEKRNEGLNELRTDAQNRSEKKQEKRRFGEDTLTKQKGGKTKRLFCPDSKEGFIYP